MSFFTPGSWNPLAVLASGAHAEALPDPPAWLTLFFLTMLLCIAILPLTRLEHFWHKNGNKLAVGLALAAYPTFWVLFMRHDVHALLETGHEYISFIVLLGTLFYVSGGIVLQGDLRATPRTNLTFLTAGTLLASVIGTTGASMLLIRPVLRTNRQRKYRVHVVIFFIFLVSNVGGSLLPIGDPPLFLGYLRGVPFFWTLGLWKPFVAAAGMLLAAFFVLDRGFYRREPARSIVRDDAEVERLKVSGKLNMLWLLGIVLCVAFIGPQFGLAREIAMIACAIASAVTSPKGLRKKNEFTWFPILEVAALFVGIFLTMVPALILLRAHGGSLGVDSPLRFFWVTGVLSSFLDNAPTYLVFFQTAQGMTEQGLLGGELVQAVGIPTLVLQAISLGAVFMGANTYIGNGPNFMVKAIAEEQRVEMPGFFGYMRWSLTILFPILIVVGFIFL